jgi:dCMP deaminase
MKKTDLDYLGLAFYIAHWSKDPSTRVGAVISRQDGSIVSQGVNGFPRGCDDSPELFADRSRKYPRIIHAEQNAMGFANERLHGCAIHVAVPAPFQPVCADCAKMVVQRGIRRVVFPHITRSNYADRWEETCMEALQMFSEVGVEIIPIPESLWRALPIIGLAGRAF